MSTQLAEQNGPFQSMMARTTGGNVGAVSIESERAIAEARGQMQLAKMFPRDQNACYTEMMDACKLPALANVAFYTVPQGGQRVTGPSIRLAEECARIYGNFEFGHRELSRVEATPDTHGKSEIEVYAWDKEKNNRSIRQITVLHVLDTKDGPRRLRDQKDVDNKIANVASKQARGRILALLPKWLTEAAQEECRKTLAGDNTVPLSERVRKMTNAFSTFGVTTAHIETYLGTKLESMLLEQLVELTGVFNAIREGAAASEYFGENAAGAADAAGADLTAQATGALAAATQAAATPARAARATKAAKEAPPAEHTQATTPADDAPAETQKAEAPAAAEPVQTAQAPAAAAPAAKAAAPAPAAAPADVF